jgi:threonine synthase
MDVGNPNNFPRLLDLCRGRLEYVRREIWGTVLRMRKLGRDENGVGQIPLHCRSAYSSGNFRLEAYKKKHAEPAQGLVLATAHAAKFAEIVEKAIGIAPPLPDRLAAYLKRPKLSVAMSSNYEDFKQFLLAH